MKTSLFTLASILSLTLVKASGGFASTCEPGWRVWYTGSTWDLEATCYADHGQLVQSSIVLGSCIGNSNGVLVGEHG